VTRSSRRRLTAQFFASLSPGARLLFYAGVFCCFAPVGLFDDIATLGQQPALLTALTTFLSGGLAVACAAAGIHRPRWVLVIVLVTVIVMIGMRHAFPDVGLPHSLASSDILRLRDRLTTTMALTVAAVALAYVCFVVLIQREAARFLAAQTEIRLARDIHQALVPPVAGRSRTVEWRGVSRPSGDVGGDLVDVMDGDAGWFACVADVTGHGVAAGVFMGMFKTAVRSGLEEAGTLGELLTRINRRLMPLKQPQMFVTAACLRLGAGGALEYALAGHPPILHISARTNTSAWITDGGIAVGLIDSTRFESRTCGLDPGDVLIVVTDGLTEVFDRAGHDLGLEGLRQAVALLPSTARLEDIEAALFEAAGRHGPQIDDQTVLVLRVL
jgi:serine phosphatase RsbU (regulator of sigma subunit)